MSDAEGLRGAVGSDDRRAGLRALRDRLAVELERVADEGFCPACKRGSSSVAPLAARLSDVMAQLDDLGVGAKTEETPVDELFRRRQAAAARQSGSAG